MKVYKRMLEVEQLRRPFALAVVVSDSGSTPRNTTAKMLIEEDGSITDTIGGGPVEKEVIEDAIQAIKDKESKLTSYKLNKEVEGGLNMNCGGNLQVFIEVFNPKATLMLIGGGHVNYAVSKVADILEYDLVVVDDREEFCNVDRFPTAKELILVKDYTQDLQKLDINHDFYVVIATKNDDLAALEGVVRSRASYIGAIGSKRKVKKMFETLIEKGCTQGELDRVYSPMGLNIGADTPEEIAISILGEIIATSKGEKGQSLRESRGF